MPTCKGARNGGCAFSVVGLSRASTQRPKMRSAGGSR